MKPLKPIVNLVLIFTLALGAALCMTLGGVALAQPSGTGYLETDFTSKATDANIVNPWGIVAEQPSDLTYVANKGTGTITIAGPNGVPVSPVITVKSASGTGLGVPTGLVFNPTNDFIISNSTGTAFGPSQFLVVTEDGTIQGWNPNVSSTSTVVAVNNSKQNPTPGYVYKGVALGYSRAFNRNYLFATNFRAGVVDMYNARFRLVKSFTDPTLPRYYAPTGILTVGDRLLVTFARRDNEKLNEVAGQGSGYVSVFDTSGFFIGRFASRGSLNSPAGIALVPANWGDVSNSVLVANHGSGQISVFDLQTGTPQGRLRDPQGGTITIDGLRGLDFAPNPNGTGPALFFTAGSSGGKGGLVGTLTPAP